MPDYKKGKIYKIVDLNEEMIYVGSTCQKLSQRMASHRMKYRRLDYCSSYDIFDKYGVENCEILLIENYPCNSKEELHKKEGEYIRQLNCVNKNISGRNQKQYQQDNKDKIKEYLKQYNQDNKDKIKQYREDNKDKIKEYKKQYNEKNNEKNKDKKKEYNKQYREKQKLK
jgi:hypothetical protein